MKDAFVFRISALTRAMAIGLLASGLVACGGGSDVEEIEYVERNVEEIYNKAYDFLENNDFRRASIEFDEVERQHPYSQWARRAMVMSAYSYYRQNKYSDAILSAKRFIALHPGNKQAPYMYYLIAQSQYEQISDVSRDQKNTELARQALTDLIRRYPNTDYARDARLKLDLTIDHLASKEMAIGRYYLTRNSHVAAINRFKNVVLQYQTTSHVEEALHRLTEAYLALGMEEEAKASAAVLGHNYPSSPWYQDSYRMLVERDFKPAASEAWYKRAWKQIF
ncbi:MAG: outer membrane protein assembly factor BamD [Parvibaculales bacterium]